MSRGDWKDRIRGLFGFGRREEPALDMPPLYSKPSTPAPKVRKSKKEKKKDHDDWKRWSDWNRGESYWKASTEVCKKGIIESDPTKRVSAVWMAEKESDGKLHLYMTCVKPKCAAVNDFSKHSVREDGSVSPCIVCVKCDTHEFVKLEGWDLGKREEEKTAADLEWEARWKNWKPSKDGKDGKGWYGGDMGGMYFMD